MKSPTTKQEYWDLIDIHWDDLMHLMNLYLPTFKPFWIDKTPIDKLLGDYIRELKETRNPRIARCFNACWFNVPEENGSEGIHRGWEVLVMLCREEWALVEGRELDQ